MSSKPIVSIVLLLAGAACVRESNTPVAAQPAPPAPAVTTNAPTTSSATRGTIVGSVVTNPWKAVKGGAIVYLEDAPREPGTNVTASVDNHSMTFVPFIAVVTAGGTVTFSNTDPLTHNVFSPDGERWDIGEIPANGSVSRTFDKPSTYTLLCNLHQNMLAYLVVTPSSYFARVGADGSYVIPNVPPGTYKLTAWSPRLQAVTKPTVVTADEVTVNFELARAK